MKNLLILFALLLAGTAHAAPQYSQNANNGLRIFTTSAAITQIGTDQIICVNKGTGAATAVTLISQPTFGQRLEVKDCKGDANTNNITITPNSGNIDGSATYVINTAYGDWNGFFNGTQWVTTSSR